MTMMFYNEELRLREVKCPECIAGYRQLGPHLLHPAPCSGAERRKDHCEAKMSSRRYLAQRKQTHEGGVVKPVLPNRDNNV